MEDPGEMLYESSGTGEEAELEGSSSLLPLSTLLPFESYTPARSVSVSIAPQ